MPNQQNPNYDSYYTNAMSNRLSSTSDPYMQGHNGYGGSAEQNSTNNAMMQSMGSGAGNSGGNGGSGFGSSFSNAASSWGAMGAGGASTGGSAQVGSGGQQNPNQNPKQNPYPTYQAHPVDPMTPQPQPQPRPQPPVDPNDPSGYLRSQLSFLPPEQARIAPPEQPVDPYRAGQIGQTGQPVDPFTPHTPRMPQLPQLPPSSDPNMHIGGGPAPYNPYPSMPPSYPPPPPGATAPPSYGRTTGSIGDPGAQGGPTILDRYNRGAAPPPSAVDPLTGFSSQAMNAGGDRTIAPVDWPTRLPQPTPQPTTPTTPTPTTVTHQPDAPMIPGTPVIPSRRQSVTAPVTSTPAPTVPDAGGSGAAPVPNPAADTPATPSLAGQNNGQPLQPGATGENASDLAMRWKQSLAATDPQLANNVTPLMVAFFRENNPGGLDPVAWMKTPGNLDAFNRYVAANPQGAPVGSLNVGVPLQQYNPTPVAHATTTPATPAAVVAAPAATPSSSTGGEDPQSGMAGTPATAPTKNTGTGAVVPPDAQKGAGIGAGSGGAGSNVGSSTGGEDPQSGISGGAGNASGGAGNNPNAAPPAPGNEAVMQNASAYLHSLLNPEFANEQRDLSRNMNAQAALTGDSQSGGFGEEAGRAQGNLIGQQGSRLTDYLTQATEADKSRQLQQHIADIQNATANKQIDSNLAIAQLNDSTTRYGIKTNDDLQRFLNDKNNVLAKYGIDSQAVSARYAAEQQAAGQAASGNAAYNAALLNSAVSKEIASMNNETQRTANQQQYNLGVLGINATNYRADQSNLLAYLQSLLGNAPGQITAPPTGGYVPFGP